MKFNKPEFWKTKKSIFPFLLMPITLIVNCIIRLRKIFSKRKSFNIPIICVGNIYIGGTGKTPSSIYLAKELQKKGRKPVILRKYYKGHNDEHYLLKNNFSNVIIEEDRSKGILRAENDGFDSVILDDGFQDYSINKNLSIICFNKNQLIGNGYILPSGPLREGIDALQESEVVLINGKPDKDFEEKIYKVNKKLEIYYSIYNLLDCKIFQQKKLVAFAGIGNPDNFFKILIENNLDIFKTVAYPDHYNYSKSELINLVDYAKKNNCEIVTTEKDYLRILKYNIEEIKCLKVKLEIINNEKFLKKVLNVYN